MFSTFSLDNPQTWTGLLLPVLGAIAVLIVGFVLAQLAQQAVRQWVPRAGGNSVTIAPLVGQAVRYAIIIFAIVTALGFLGVPQASILTVVGAASLALALSLQNTLSNVASGIMLAWIRPVAVGEYIKGDGVEGEVVEIGLFGTRLRSTTGIYVFTNNNKLWNGAIINHSREPRRRIDVDVTIPDTASVAAVRKSMLAVANKDKRVLKEPEAMAFVSGFGATTVTLELRVWVATPDYRNALRDITEAAKDGVNKVLAASGEDATAEVSENKDPHATESGAA
jgi:small conductance mechanosensitive channel